MYGETFYGRHTAQHQLQWMQIKIRNEICDSCIVSSWALLIFLLVYDDQIQISSAMWLRKMENLPVTFCCLWLPEKLWLLGGKPPRDPFKTLITLLPVSFSQTAVGWLGKMVSTLTGYLLTDGLNCLTVKYLAGWHFE